MVEHILKNTAATLAVEFSAGAADADVAVVVTDANGAVVKSAVAVQDPQNDARYTLALGPQPEVASLVAKWTGTWGVEQSLEFPVEVIGAQLFTIAQLRSFGDQKLSNAVDYPDDLLAEARASITDFFQEVCEVSFVPRYGRAILNGTPSSLLWLPNGRVSQLLGVTLNGSAFDATAISQVRVDRYGRMWRQPGWYAPYPNGVQVEYVHGYRFPPGRISQAAMVLAREELLSSVLSSRALSFQNDLGVTRVWAPSFQYPTGIPMVDVTLERYQETMEVAP